ncbi:LnmK family bifunctional acyltransferase/decarboxylase [Streptomyces sp. NPDC020965]|uniref:LnmK family bifunctional acyltransferase/decarboxylase n=1 Tax=Streptomyces sp. NPDC020965 TaxID=3365105 RepID=UPI003792F1C3
MTLIRSEDVIQFDGKDTLTRRVNVSLSMCSAGSLIYAKMGDWTWEAVNFASGMNVYTARRADGLPAYLSFYYFRVSSSEVLHPNGITFGDEIDVTSRVFDLGSQSVLTLHRVSRAGKLTDHQTLDPIEAYERPRPDCMYVETFNRWISRGDQTSNKGLVDASPADFRHKHLSPLPEAYTPRSTARNARKAGSFFPAGMPGFFPKGPPFHTKYALDVARDLNGVRLVYFASYFSIADIALSRAWRARGREDRHFIDRVALDYRLGFFGNADPDAVFDIAVQIWQDEQDPRHEFADIVISEQGGERILAVAGIRTLLGASEPLTRGAT